MRNCPGITRSGKISKLSKDKPQSLELEKSAAPEGAEVTDVKIKMFQLPKDLVRTDAVLSAGTGAA